MMACIRRDVGGRVRHGSAEAFWTSAVDFLVPVARKCSDCGTWCNVPEFLCATKTQDGRICHCPGIASRSARLTCRRLCAHPNLATADVSSSADVKGKFVCRRMRKGDVGRVCTQIDRRV